MDERETIRSFAPFCPVNATRASSPTLAAATELLRKERRPGAEKKWAAFCESGSRSR